MGEWDDRVQAAAKKLFEIGNKRIGHRDWEAVEDHYLFEAQAALAAAGVPLLMRQRDVAWTKAHEIAESCVVEFVAESAPAAREAQVEEPRGIRCPKCHLAFEVGPEETAESLGRECGVGHHADTEAGCPAGSTP